MCMRQWGEDGTLSRAVVTAIFMEHEKKKGGEEGLGGGGGGANDAVV